jgi:ADP-ribose pyrophosphatase YjhB (NUDIX family)
MTHFTPYPQFSGARPKTRGQSTVEQHARTVAKPAPNRPESGLATTKAKDGGHSSPVAEQSAAHAENADTESGVEDGEGISPAGVLPGLRTPGAYREGIELDELAELAQKYGAPRRLRYAIQADEYIYSYRWRKDSDRRAEVVFAIQDPGGHVWVHAKPNYPAHIFRLPSGGVDWDESIEHALLREVHEETCLNVRIVRFLGLLEYTFVRGDSTASFSSYVFHLHSAGGVPVACEGEAICEFRPVLPSRLSEIAVELRNLIGDRRGWGQWRALSHDLVCESLSNQPYSNQSLLSKGNFAC